MVDFICSLYGKVYELGLIIIVVFLFLNKLNIQYTLYDLNISLTYYVMETLQIKYQFRFMAWHEPIYIRGDTYFRTVFSILSHGMYSLQNQAPTLIYCNNLILI